MAEETGATRGEEALYEVRRAEAPGPRELFPVPTALNVPGKASSLTDVARVLAGMDAANGRGDYSTVRELPGWLTHQQRLNELWGEYQVRHEQPIRAWAAREIRDLVGAPAVFYPFSGPDFLFANAFFPHADTFVLCGLEPAEPLPPLASLSGDEIDAGLSGLRTAINNVMQYSFFITKDMRNDLQATRFRGVLPVLLVFLARSGHTIDSVDTIRLDAGGNPVLSDAASGNTQGLLIRARGPNGAARRVFYIRQDLSNDSMHAGAPFLRLIDQLGRPPAFTKSASYLMHEDGFSVIRDYLLRRPQAVVQDPSGVPYRAFVQRGWNLRLYGNYLRTLDLFGESCQQPDLAAAYQEGRHGAQPLPFGIGYLYQPSTTCLMVARAPR